MMPLRVRVYIAAVWLCAIAACVVLVAVGGPPTRDMLAPAICFALIGIITQMMGDPFARTVTASITFIPFLATALLVPNIIAIGTVGAAVVITELKAKREPTKIAFNIGQLILAASLSILVFRAAGGVGFLNDSVLGRNALDLPAADLLRGTALPVSFLLLNSLLVSGVIAVHDKRNALEIWRANHAATVVYDLASLPFVFLFALVYATWGLFATILVAVPLFGVRHLYRTKRQLERSNQELLQLMVAAIEARDPYTSGHSRRVSEYSRLIAQAVGLAQADVELVSRAGLLHDVGKIHEVFAPILQKPGKLTDEERLIMETHPIKSAELISHVSHLHDIVEPVRHHHENWDGTGYPDGLKGEAIPLASRIIMLADTIDAMTTDRPYRAALGEAEVRRELLKWRGIQFDPMLCDRLLASPIFATIMTGTKPRDAHAPLRLVRPPKPSDAAIA
jgi:putative nucleotidyltransferase with HDIG domain